MRNSISALFLSVALFITTTNYGTKTVYISHAEPYNNIRVSSLVSKSDFANCRKNIFDHSFQNVKEIAVTESEKFTEETIIATSQTTCKNVKNATKSDANSTTARTKAKQTKQSARTTAEQVISKPIKSYDIAVTKKVTTKTSTKNSSKAIKCSTTKNIATTTTTPKKETSNKSESNITCATEAISQSTTKTTTSIAAKSTTETAAATTKITTKKVTTTTSKYVPGTIVECPSDGEIRVYTGDDDAYRKWLIERGIAPWF